MGSFVSNQQDDNLDLTGTQRFNGKTFLTIILLSQLPFIVSVTA
jgi:hypothetical protein